MHEQIQFPKQSIQGNRHLATVGDRSYDVYRLIHETRELPVVSQPVAGLFDDIVDSSFWSDAEGKSFSVRELYDAMVRRGDAIDWDETIRATPRLAEHFRKIKAADYSYPVLILSHYGIIDGIHRLTKAHLDGAETISARIIENMPESALHHSDSE